MYIRAPTILQLPTITKGKVPKIKKVKWHEVPEFYRKKRLVDIIQPYVFETMLYVVGIAERGRTLWIQWKKKGK
jgi:hypothetical protein